MNRETNKIYCDTKQLRNKTYQSSEVAIQRALLLGIRNRNVNFSIGELCLKANITRPTFYAHHSSANDAMYSYEAEVLTDFEMRLPNKPLRREVLFTILLGSITHHRNYFSATLEGGNSYTLIKMLDLLKPYLVPPEASRCTYLAYRGNLKTIIQIWGTVDHFQKNRIPFYAKRLARTRIIRWDEE